MRCQIVAALAFAAPAIAQVSGNLDVGASVGQSAGPAWASSRLMPSFEWNASPGSVRFSGSPADANGRWLGHAMSLDAAVHSSSFGRWRMSGSAFVGPDSARGGVASEVASAAIATTVGAAQRTGVWLGAGVGNSSANGLQFGVWRVIRSAVISVSTSSRLMSESSFRMDSSLLVSGIDTVQTDTGVFTWPVRRWVIDSVAVSRLRAQSDVRVRADWAAGSFSFSALVAGTSEGTARRSTMWGDVTTAYQFAPRLAITGAVGVLPGSGGATPTARFGSLALRVTPRSRRALRLPAPVSSAPTAFEMRTLPGGLRRIVLRVPGAHSVELSGDFNDWKPVALDEVSAGQWEAVVPIAPGSHRVNIRVDGGRWVAPPGVPATNDEFNGRVGLIVAP